jgi:hypothetical protein
MVGGVVMMLSSVVRFAGVAMNGFIGEFKASVELWW